jgi:hypothetical protein
LLLLVVASTQIAQAESNTGRSLADEATPGAATATPTLTIPTVTIPRSRSASVPTVTIPQPTATPVPTPTARPVVKRRPAVVKRRADQLQVPAIRGQWILAYLTSYCPGSAGLLSSSGQTVFYGMLANDYYALGTRVYLPVLGMTGVVLDRIGSFSMWNHFDVWSPVCYSTPTGWYRVAVQTS